MKQNITLALDQRLLNKVRALAAQRGTSVSVMLADELPRILDRESAYEQAKVRALELLRSPFHLGGEKMASPGSAP